MSEIEWKDGEIEGVLVRSTPKHTDDRGWLAETFRSDEIPEDIMPAMAYISATKPGIGRGPHEHCDQTDLFGFMGPGDLTLKLWDNRQDSPTHGNKISIVVGESNPVIAIVPPGVVHGYINISDTNAYVLNLPNRLFMGKGRSEPVDEIRHEDSEGSPFSMK